MRIVLALVVTLICFCQSGYFGLKPNPNEENIETAFFEISIPKKFKVDESDIDVIVLKDKRNTIEICTYDSKDVMSKCDFLNLPARRVQQMKDGKPVALDTLGLIPPPTQKVMNEINGLTVLRINKRDYDENEYMGYFLEHVLTKNKIALMGKNLTKKGRRDLLRISRNVRPKE